MLSSLYHKISQKTSAYGAWVTLFVTLFLCVCIQPALGKVPNDPNASQWSYTDTNLAAAWDVTTGSRDVVVAVVDNGFDSYHPDLVDNVWKNIHEIPNNNLDDDLNGFIDDVWGWNFVPEDTNYDGTIDAREEMGSNDPRPKVIDVGILQTSEEAIHHGTLVAGLIGASANNQKFGAGINWNVRLMNVKVVGNTGVGTIVNLDRAIRYAADNGADVINFSLVADEKPGLEEAIQYAYERGVVMVAAAGNDRMFIDSMRRYPICIDGPGQQRVLGVTAIDELHHFAQFSNYGSSCVDITAPGVGIASTMRYAPQYGLTEFYSEGWNGTSFAAPFVSGAAALIKSIHPEWGPTEIYQALLSTVQKTPPANEQEYAHLFGKGRLQIDKAVAYARSKPSLAHTLFLIDGSSKKVWNGTLKSASLERSPAIVPVSVDDSALITVNGEQQLVTVRKRDTKTSTVILYSLDWEKKREWNIPATGILSLLVANVRGDEQEEIIVAPTYADKNVYRIFSQDGAKLDELIIKTKHAGVKLGSATSADGRDILAVYDQGTASKLYRYSTSNRLVQTVPLTRTQKNSIPLTVDIDGNGEEEYALISPNSAVEIKDKTGAFVLSFFAYDPASAPKDLRATVGDADGDGKSDIIVGTGSNGLPVRVWSSSGKKIHEWFLPANESYRQLKAFLL